MYKVQADKHCMQDAAYSLHIQLTLNFEIGTLPNVENSWNIC